MLGNLKDFISVVQDGLSANNNLRQTLQEVQKVKYYFQEKQKAASECIVNCGAGGEVLEKYQETWAEIHKCAEENARAADGVDKLILELHHKANTRLKNANDLAINLAHLPNLTVAVAQCMDSLKNIQELVKTVEEDLVELEDAVERSKMEKWKLDHHYHLSMYKEKKLAGLEGTRSKLAHDSSERSLDRERRQLAELQQRQETSSTAFQIDVAKYLVMGSLPAAASAATSITLDQVQLEDDNTDLETFLES